MLTKTFYVYIITILICTGLLWTVCTLLLKKHNSYNSLSTQRCMRRTVDLLCCAWTTAWGVVNLLQPSGYYMYHQVSHRNITFCPHSVFMCFVWISEQTVIISLYSINWLGVITHTDRVYGAVRAENRDGALK